MSETLTFDIEEINLIQEISDSQLAIAEVKVCHSGMNLHQKPIDLDALKQAEPTIINKWLVAGFDGVDFKGHEGKAQMIIGFFPKENNFRYIKEDDKVYFVANAIVSKMYASWAFDILKDTKKKCSMEITLLQTEKRDDGYEWITSYVYNGVTVLGNSHNPACPGSEVELVNFSADEFIEKTEKILAEFSVSEDEIGKSDPIEIDNSKDSSVDGKWSNPGSKLYKPILKASNYKSLVKEAYLIVEDGYEDSPSTSLKYPHHVIKNGELVVHKSGVQAALSRAKQQGLTGEPISHLKKHYKELDLDMENFSIENQEKEVEQMSFNKAEFAEKFGMTAQDMMDMMREACGQMKYQVESREYSKYWMIDYDANYMYAYDEQNGGKVAIPYSIEDGKVKCDYENVKPCKTMTQWVIMEDDDNDEDSVMMAIEKAKADKEAFAKSNEEQKNNEKEDNKENEDKEKQFSTDEIKKELEELKVEFASLKESNEQLKNENEQLKKFKSDIEEKEKTAKVDFTIKEAIDLGMPEEKANEFKEKAKEFSIDNIHIWVNEVKANTLDFAKEKTKANKDDGFTRIGLTWTTTSDKKKGLWD